MKPERIVRFEVANREVLQRLAAAPLPMDLPSSNGGELQFFRSVYYDTSDRALENRNATVRLQIGESQQLLTVDVRDYSAVDGGIVRRHAETQVAWTGTEDLFGPATEPGRIVRALVDPARLGPVYELEVVRRERTAHLNGEDIKFAYDAITVRRGELAGELYEIEICLPTTKATRFDELIQAMEHQEGVRMTLAESVSRARELLQSLEINRLEAAVRAAREVAVVAYDRGKVAVCQRAQHLVLPTGAGSGQEACRRVLASFFGQAIGRLRFLGMSRGTESTPAIEVWLAEDVAPREGACRWLRLEDLLTMVGTPALRDARTLTALHAVARSDVASRAAARSQRGQVPEDDEDLDT